MRCVAYRRNWAHRPQHLQPLAEPAGAYSACMDTDTLPQLRHITTDLQCRAALHAISLLLEVDPERHSAEGRRLCELLQAVEAYEACRTPAMSATLPAAAQGAARASRAHRAGPGVSL